MRNKIIKCLSSIMLMGLLTFGTTTSVVSCGGDSNETTGILDSISINTDNCKKSFAAGDKFDSTGLVVTAVYDNEQTKDVTSLATTSLDGKTLSVADTRVVVSYTEGEIKKTKSYTIEVSGPRTISGEGKVTINGQDTFELEAGSKIPTGTTFVDTVSPTTVIGWKIGTIFAETIEGLIEKFVMPSADVVVLAIHDTDLEDQGQTLGFSKWIPSPTDKAETKNGKNANGGYWTLTGGVSTGVQKLKTPAEGEALDETDPWSYEYTTYTTTMAVTDSNMIYIEKDKGLGNPGISHAGTWYYVKMTNNSTFPIDIAFGCEFGGFEIAAESLKIAAGATETLYCCNKITVRTDWQDDTAMSYVKFNGSYEAGLSLSIVGYQLGQDSE